MGHSHTHSHPTGHAGGRYRRRLAITFALVLAFLVVELVVALRSGSLALLSDAGHMSADVVALGAALLATTLATRPDRTGRRTFGHYRAEVFASGLTVLIMLGVAVFVVVEAVGRIGDPPHIQSLPMLIVGILGLVVNLISMVLLHAGAQESLNVKGAYFEVIADAAGSVGVIVAAIAIQLTGQAWWDTLIAVALGLFVAVRALMLGREVLKVLAQEVPDGLSTERLRADLAAIESVRDVHDLHVWTLTSGMHVATAHLVIEPDSADRVLTAAQDLLAHDYGIEHATVQTETSDDCRCQHLDW